MQQDPNKRQQLYSFLKSNNLVKDDFETFSGKYSEKGSASQLYQFLTDNKLTEKSQEDFHSEYFGDLKTPQETTPQNSETLQENTISESELQKPESEINENKLLKGEVEKKDNLKRAPEGIIRNTEVQLEGYNSPSTVLMGHHGGYVPKDANGKHPAFPTIFPKDPNNQTSNPKDWIVAKNEDEAYAIAKERGEVLFFDTKEEAAEVAKGSWKNTSKKEPIVFENEAELAKNNSEASGLRPGETIPEREHRLKTETDSGYSDTFNTYQEQIEVNEDEKNEIVLEIENDIAKKGVWNTIKDGAKNWWNNAFNDEGLQVSTDPLNDAKAEAKKALEEKGEEVTEQSVLAQAKEIEFKKRTESLVESKRRAFMKDLTEDEKSDLETYGRFEKSSFSKNTKSLLFEQNVLRNELNAKETDIVAFTKQIKQLQENGEPITKEMEAEYHEQHKKYTESRVKTLEQYNKLLDSKDDTATAKDNLDLFKRDYGWYNNFMANGSSAAINIISGVVDFVPYLNNVKSTVLPRSKFMQSIDVMVDAVAGKTADELNEFSKYLSDGVMRPISVDDINTMGDLGSWISNTAIAQQVPILMLVSTGAGGIATLGVSGTGSKYGEMIEEENANGLVPIRYSNAQKIGVPVVFGGAETIGAMVDGMVLKGALKTLASATKAESRMFAKGFFQQAKEVGSEFFKAAAKEIPEEVSTQFLQNALDKYSLGKNIDLSAGLKDAAAASLVFSFLPGGAKIIGNLIQPFTTDAKLGKLTSEIALIETQLNSGETVISDNIRKQLNKNLSSKKNKLESLVVGISKDMKNMSDATYKKLVEIENKKSEIREDVLEIQKDKSISKEVKEMLLKDFKEDFTSLEASRKDLIESSANKPNKRVELEEEAAAILTKEKQESGAKEFTITPSEIEQKANELESNKNTKPNEKELQETIPKDNTSKKEINPKTEAEKVLESKPNQEKETNTDKGLEVVEEKKEKTNQIQIDKINKDEQDEIKEKALKRKGNTISLNEIKARQLNERNANEEFNKLNDYMLQLPKGVVSKDNPLYNELISLGVKPSINGINASDVVDKLNEITNRLFSQTKADIKQENLKVISNDARKAADKDFFSTIKDKYQAKRDALNKSNPNSNETKETTKEETKQEVLPSEVVKNEKAGLEKSKTEKISENAKKIKGVTEISFSEDGNSVSYGTKVNQKNISVNNMTEKDIQEELDYEKEMLAKNKATADKFNKSEIESSIGMTSKEKSDAIKFNKQSLIQIEETEKIVIPFYNNKLNEIQEKGDTSTNKDVQSGVVADGSKGQSDQVQSAVESTADKGQAEVKEKTLSDDQKKQNALIDARNEYNRLTPSKKKSKNGDALVNKITRLASSLGFTVVPKGRKLDIKRKNGKGVGKISVKEQIPQSKESDIKIALLEIDNGLVSWNGAPGTPRVDLGISWADIRKGETDLKAGKTNTQPAKRLVEAIRAERENGGFRFIEQSGNQKTETFAPLTQAERIEDALTEAELKEISEQDNKLANESTEWFNSLDAETQNEILGNYENKENKPGEVQGDTEKGQSQVDVSGKKESESDGRRGRDGRAVNSSRSGKTLKGAPTRQKVKGSDIELTELVKEYAEANGIEYKRQSEYVKVNESFAKRVAEEYDKMEHNPSDPIVKEAYQNLIKQTIAQYKVLEKAGYKFFFFNEKNDPYNGNPWNALSDLRENKTMGSFETLEGFGSDKTLDVSDNPMLADTGIKWGFGSVDGKPRVVLANDLFRVVHDAFGHGIEGSGFRSRGEENAWQSHARLFTGSAVGAITSETRGQNSWLNFGKHAEHNKSAKIEDTIFADQKTGLMPEWTWKDNFDAGETSEKNTSKSPELKEVKKQIEKAESDVLRTKNALEAKAKKLDQTINEDQSDLFGERKSQSDNKLFDERIDSTQRNEATAKERQALKDAETNLKKLKEKKTSIEKNGEVTSEMDFKESEPKPTKESKSADEPIKVYHGGSVKVISDLDNGDPLFVSEDKSQAKEYTKENEGSVSEFEINKNTIASEDQARETIKELGLKSKDPDWDADELAIHELIDPNFETSMSISDRDKLFKALISKGYESIRFTDSNVKTLKSDIQNIVIFNPQNTLSKVFPKDLGGKNDLYNLENPLAEIDVDGNNFRITKSTTSKMPFILFKNKKAIKKFNTLAETKKYISESNPKKTTAPKPTTKETKSADERKDIANVNVDEFADALKDFLGGTNDPDLKGNGIITQDQIIDLIAKSAKVLIAKGIDIDVAIKQVIAKLKERFNFEVDENLVKEQIKKSEPKKTTPPPKKPEPAKNDSDSPKIKEQAFTTRSFKSENLNSKTKEKLKKLGLNYDVESQSVAQENAEKIIKELGILEAYKLAVSGQIRGGARTWIKAQMFEVLNQQVFDAQQKGDLELEEALTDELADIMKEFANEKTLSGQEAAMLHRIYQRFDMKYDLNFAKEKWNSKFDSEMSPEVKARLKRLEEKIKKYQENVKKLEEKIGTMVEQEAFNNIQEVLKRQQKKTRSNSKITKRSQVQGIVDKLSSIEAKIRANAYSDATLVTPILLNGIATIKASIKVSANAYDAIEKGIAQIKAELKKIGQKLDNEQELRDDLNELYDVFNEEKNNKKPSSEERLRKMYISRLNKDIEALDTQIENKKREILKKGEDKYKNDDEINGLRELKREKQEELSEIDPSYSERLKLSKQIDTAEKSIKEYERKIAESDFSKKDTPKKQVDATLKKLREKRDGLQKKYEAKKRDFLNKQKKEPTYEENVEIRLGQIQESIDRIKNKPKTDNTGKSSIWSAEISKLEKERTNLRKQKSKENSNINSNIEQGAIKIPQKLLYELVESGIDNINDLTQAVHDVLKNDYPNLTLREVRDAITGYGKQINETKDEIKLVISKLKTDGKQYSALEDLALKKRPKRSGRKPKKLTEEQRNRVKQIRELLKTLPIDDSIDKDKYYKSALEAYKTRLNNRIKDLNDALQKNERIINEKRNTPLDAEAEALIEKRDAIQKEYDETFGKPYKSDETLINEIVKRKEKSLRDLEDKLAYAKEEKAEQPKPTKRTVSDPKIDALTSAIESKRNELNEVLEEVGVAEGKRLDRAKKYAERRTKELQDKIKNGDYSRRKPKTFVYDKQLIEAKRILILQKTKFDIEFEKQEFKELGRGSKLLEYFYRAFGTFKGLKATADLSAMLRQGVLLGSRNPIEYKNATIDMHKFAFSDKKYKNWIAEVESSNDFVYMVEDGLSITDTSGDVLRSEERFVGSVISSIPGIGKITDGSERAYGGFLNSLRVSVYRKLVKKHDDMGFSRQTHPKLYKNIAKFVNNSTGRGEMTPDKRLAKLLNAFLFSPRMISGMIGIVGDMGRKDSTPYLRKQAATSLATFVGYQFAMKLLISQSYQLLVMPFTGEDEDDITQDINFVSTDFNKLKINNTRYDVSSGYGIGLRTLSRAVLNEKSKGIDYENESYDDIFYKSSLGEFGDFLMNKMSPLAAQLYKLKTKQHPTKFRGDIEDANALDYMQALFVPLTITELMEGFEKDTPKSKLAFDTLLTIYGVGVQTYGDEKKEEKKKTGGYGYR